MNRADDANPDTPNNPPPDREDHPYASRGGLKLEAALRASGIDVAGKSCADLGCSTGGFTSCLLHHGAAKVYAVDTAYGELDWSLRNDPRVVVMERRNALHAAPPPPEGQTGLSGDQVKVDLVTIDLGWTRQDKALAAALRWLSPTGTIITLVKPHYERPRDTAPRGRGKRKQPPLDDDRARAIAADVLNAVDADASLGLKVLGRVDSPIHGSKGGNLEVLAWLARR